MPATVTVLYPRKDGGTFDVDYYLKTHMPLAHKAWKEFGFTSWKVTKFSDDAPYMYGVVMDFESMEGFGKAIKSPAVKEVMDDVANFSNIQPVLAAGETVATGP